MTNYTKSHGANARSQSWEEVENEVAQTRGNWVPLEALEEEVYAATPQLRAMPAPRRQVFAPARQRVEEVRPTTSNHVRSLQAAAAPRVAQQAPAPKVVQARAVAMVAGAGFLAVALYVTISAALEWTQVKLDDFQYGRPRTSQIDAYVGHGEGEGMPSHFIAMNLNRRVTIIELPGGDTAKATTIVGPYLFGQGEDLTPVQAVAQDINSDGKPDLVVTVKSEQLLYLNDGAAFKLATDEERSAIEKSLSAAPKASTSGPPANGVTK